MLSPHLEHCRARVKEAKCEVIPKWANGTKMLIPFTEKLCDDLAAVGKERRRPGFDRQGATLAHF